MKGPITKLIEASISNLRAGDANESKDTHIIQLTSIAIQTTVNVLGALLPRVAELEPTWISIQDKMPEDMGTVLLLFSKDEFVIEGHIDGTDWYKHTGPANIQYCSEPTHWMKIPVFPN